MSDPQEGYSTPARDRMEEGLLKLFAPGEETLSAERELDAQIFGIVQEFLRSTQISTSIALGALVEKFKQSEIPAEPGSIAGYMEYLADQVVTYSTNTSSPRFIGHMTSALPYFMRPLSRLILAMNQNLVKVETSKAMTPYERQALGMMHRLVYDFSDDFYQQHIQHGSSTLGMVTSGGTVANIAALWCARNASLQAAEGFAGLGVEGLPAALDFYGHRGAVIIGSSLMHYSFDKAAELLGVGTKGLIRIPIERNNRVDLAALRQAIADCRARNQHIIAIVGIAGTTDSGAIDPLTEMAEIAEREKVHFHVDAAWGGATLFSDRHRHKLAGIERADSVTIDGHKQLYLPMGIGLLLLRDPTAAQVIERHARYIVRKGSIDLGKRALEGSRSGMALLLHAALSVIGRRGYGFLINEGIRKTQYMTKAVRARQEFELLLEPEINILNYRYLPEAFREKARGKLLTAPDNDSISRFNESLQKAQRRAGHSFVSRTKLDASCYGKATPIAALRAVIANPLTTESDIDAVLDEQVKVAAELASSNNASSMRG
jgi:putative pyridoxal-dependent aspartate 1-decarboxylase